MLSGVSLAALALVFDRRKLGARAALTNYTMDDMNMTIIYSPSTWWFASNNASGCDYCLAPKDHDAAFDGTWHHGLHVLPNTDDDDSSTSSSLSLHISTSGSPSVPTPTSSSSIPSPTPSSGDDDEGKNDGKGNDDDDDDLDADGDTDSNVDSDSHNESDSNNDHDSDSDSDSNKDRDSGDKGHSRKGRNRRARRSFLASTTGVAAALETASPYTTQKFDSDDPQFVDAPVFVQFNFSGTSHVLFDTSISMFNVAYR